MGVGQKNKPSQLLKRIKLAGSCKDAGADVPLPVVVPARACRTNAGLFAACLTEEVAPADTTPPISRNGSGRVLAMARNARTSSMRSGSLKVRPAGMPVGLDSSRSTD